MKNDKRLCDFFKRTAFLYKKNDVVDIKMLDTKWIEQVRANSLARSKIMVFNATFKNISVISWRQFFWWRKSGVPGEYHRPDTSH